MSAIQAVDRVELRDDAAKLLLFVCRRAAHPEGAGHRAVLADGVRGLREDGIQAGACQRRLLALHSFSLRHAEASDACSQGVLSAMGFTFQSSLGTG